MSTTSLGLKQHLVSSHEEVKTGHGEGPSACRHKNGHEPAVHMDAVEALRQTQRAICSPGTGL